MKLVKAMCEKTNKKIVLQVSDDGREILGFFKTDDASFNDMSSQVRVVNATVRSTSGSVAFGSDEKTYRRLNCKSDTAITKDCLACKFLKCVYTKGAGTCVQLKKGEVADIPLSKILVGCNWDTRCDIDSSVVLCGQRDYELVYFGNKSDNARSIIHRGDNLTGADGYVPGTEDDENIDVNLEKVPSGYDRIVFVINIYSGAISFLSVKGLVLTIYDADSRDKLIQYNVTMDFKWNNALVIGEARRRGSNWEFMAIGEGTRVSSVSDLASYCARKRF